MTTLRFLFSGVLALALTACSGAGDEVHPDDAALLGDPAGATEASPATPEASTARAPAVQQVEAVQLANDAVAVGSALTADGAAAAPKPAYAMGDSVHASVPVGGYAPGTEVAVYWFSPDGASVKMERKPIPAGARFVNFGFGRADGMAAGRYTAQIDIDDVPVGMVDFAVE